MNNITIFKTFKTSILSILFISNALPAFADKLELHFIDVGQGDSTLVICPNGKTILIDAGSKPGPPHEMIRDYLDEQLDRHAHKVDTLVITHPDIDHFNILPDVLGDIPIGKIYMVGKKTDYKDAHFRTWISKFRPDSIKVLSPGYFDEKDHPNASINCGAAKVYILSAAVKSKTTKSNFVKNTLSIVLMVRFGTFDVILTGDATTETEEIILQRYPHDWLQAEVLKIGHHGSRITSTGDEWTSVVKPEVAIASAGEKSVHGHPSEEVVKRLEPFTKSAPEHTMVYSSGNRNHYRWHKIENYKESIYSTAASGNIVITSDGQDYKLEEVPYEEQ